MSKINSSQLLGVLLSVLLVFPPPLVAASPASASRTVLGSITTHGPVHVGETLMPAAGTLFAGDRVQTQLGSAIIQYQEGTRVLLGTESSAQFTPFRVQLQRGRMSFRTVSANGPTFSASTLRLEPATAKSAANVTLQGRKASVMVTEGTMDIVDPGGLQLISLKAGEARLFEEAAAAVPPPAAAPAAPPQAPGGPAASGSSRTWLIALGVALAGAGIGIAGFVRADDAEDAADAAAAQAAALQQQANALQAQLNSLQSAAAQQNSLLQQISQAQTELNAVQQQLNQLFSDVASQGGAATPAQVLKLQSLGAQLGTLTSKINQLTQTLLETTPPELSPTRNP